MPTFDLSTPTALPAMKTGREEWGGMTGKVYREKEGEGNGEGGRSLGDEMEGQGEGG